MYIDFLRNINLWVGAIRASSQTFKRTIQIVTDSGNVFLALFVAMILKYETLNFLNSIDFYVGFITILFPTIYIFAYLGLYRAFVRFASIEIVYLIISASVCSGILLAIIKLTVGLKITFSLIIIYTIVLFLLVSGIRFIIKVLVREVKYFKKETVAVYGAGSAGAKLLQTLKNDNHYKAELIIDDSINKQGKLLYGIPVMSFPKSIKYLKENNVKNILFTIPSATPQERSKILSELIDHDFFVKSIPRLSDLIDSQIAINDFRDIEIEEFLGRDSVTPHFELLAKNITAQTIFISGAGGSIGSELVRQTIKLQPHSIILFDVSENAMFLILEELKDFAEEHGIKLLPYVGSVTDRELVNSVLKSNRVENIFHAAAYKHVPLMEINAKQAIKNNTFGTLVLAEESIKCGVNNFVLISTDKAVHPKNIMGASKRLAERICQTLNSNQNRTLFTIVRFGNVLGSSGSVIPSFKKQIKLGGPVTLTHPDVSRYFMTINEAVELVLQSSSMAKGGEVFILDMGQSIKIIDLAKKMIILSGLKPVFGDVSKGSKGKIHIKTVGLRKGEKLHEELSYLDVLKCTQHPRIKVVEESKLSKEDFKKLIVSLNKNMTDDNLTDLKILMKKFASFNPD